MSIEYYKNHTRKGYIDKNVLCRIFGESKVIPIKGKMVELDIDTNLRFFVVERYDNRWELFENLSGVRFGWGITQKEAIKDASNFFINHSIPEFSKIKQLNI